MNSGTLLTTAMRRGFAVVVLRVFLCVVCVCVAVSSWLLVCDCPPALARVVGLSGLASVTTLLVSLPLLVFVLRRPARHHFTSANAHT